MQHYLCIASVLLNVLHCYLFSFQLKGLMLKFFLNNDALWYLHAIGHAIGSLSPLSIYCGQCMMRKAMYVQLSFIIVICYPLIARVGGRILFWLTPDDFIQQCGTSAPLWVNSTGHRKDAII